MKVIIIEDERIVAQNVTDLLTQEGFDVAGVADSYDSGLKLFIATEPDLVLCDVRIKGTLSGVDLMKHLKKSFDFKIIYVTAYGDEALLAETRSTNPEAFVIKPYTEKQLLMSIRLAMGSPTRLQNDHKNDPNLHAYEELSLREKQILALVGKGKSSKEISEELFISPLTVETHRKNILKKMEFDSVVQLIVFVIANKL
ncbi:MAG TPA: response regulator transcription factor [Cyclobacteriaceae bacterium]|nr:response regulator transcription factor [Cyclobacteriaceae bacterium]